MPHGHWLCWAPRSSLPRDAETVRIRRPHGYAETNHRATTTRAVAWVAYGYCKMIAARSPCLGVPEGSWIASNDLAFAIRDRFPVSPGHALVITRRVTPDWESASPEEQSAVMALVDDVLVLLRAEHGPDG